MVFWLLFTNESIQNILILSATVAPFASTGIRPVVNQLNQDTTVYYGLIFCLFSWPYMVKWHNSGIIKYIIEGWGACDKVPRDFWYIDSFSSNKAVSKSSKFIFGIEAEGNKTKQMNYSSLNLNAILFHSP